MRPYVWPTVRVRSLGGKNNTLKKTAKISIDLHYRITFSVLDGAAVNINLKTLNDIMFCGVLPFVPGKKERDAGTMGRKEDRGRTL